MQYLCYQPYNPKKLSLNTGDFFLLYYINVFFSLYKFRSEPLDVRSEPLNVRSEPLNVRSKPLNVRSKPLNGEYTVVQRNFRCGLTILVDHSKCY